MEYLYFVSADEQEISRFRLPAEHTTKTSSKIGCQNQALLPSLYHKQQESFWAIQTAICYITSVFPTTRCHVQHVMTREKCRLSRSWIPKLDFSTVKYMQLTKVIPRHSESHFGQKYKLNRKTPLELDCSQGTGLLIRGRPMAVALLAETSIAIYSSRSEQIMT